MQYQVYDVTGMVGSGKNVLGVTLGDGWYRGFLAFNYSRNLYGKQAALFCQLEVEYTNGRKEIIVSDDSWKASTGPILESDIYNGERYDNRKEVSYVNSTEPIVHPIDKLIASEAPPVRRIQEIKPIAVLTTPKGETLLDFGQNMVGRVALQRARK